MKGKQGGEPSSPPGPAGPFRDLEGAGLCAASCPCPGAPMLRAVFRLRARQVRPAADSWGFPGCLWREVSCPSSAAGHGPGYFGSSISDPGRAAPTPLSSWESGEGGGTVPSCHASVPFPDPLQGTAGSARVGPQEGRGAGLPRAAPLLLRSAPGACPPRCPGARPPPSGREDPGRFPQSLSLSLGEAARVREGLLLRKASSVSFAQLGTRGRL